MPAYNIRLFSSHVLRIVFFLFVVEKMMPTAPEPVVLFVDTPGAFAALFKVVCASLYFQIVGNAILSITGLNVYNFAVKL